MMRCALIGHTGFVGGNLLRQAPFEACYNSKNIECIAGQAFDLIVCCGAPAEKWRANREPEPDRLGVQRLMDCLGRAQGNLVILISTVDVFGRPIGVDEDSPVDPEGATAYGRHRYALEQFVRRTFPSLIVRLPGLFGTGLKKNILYDFLHGKCLDQVHSQSIFQFYGVDRLWADIGTARRHRLKLVHFGTEPVSVAEVAEAAFHVRFDNATATKPVRYDLRTQYDSLFGGGGGYVQRKATVLAGIRAYVARTVESKCA